MFVGFAADVEHVPYKHCPTMVFDQQIAYKSFGEATDKTDEDKINSSIPNIVHDTFNTHGYLEQDGVEKLYGQRALIKHPN